MKPTIAASTAGSPATPSFTGNSAIPLTLGDGLLYGVMTGATGPSVTVFGNAASSRALNF